MAKIQVRQESFAIDYNKQILPDAFVQQGSDSEFTSSSGLQQLDSFGLISLIEQAQQTLLIACAEIKGDDVIQALMTKANEGIRIYLLLGVSKANQPAIDSLSGYCLIRTGVAQQGALLLRDHATTKAHGTLFMGLEAVANSENSSWSIDLEPQQIADSYRSFCKLFWQDTDREYLSKGPGQQAVSNPDGNIVTNHSQQLSGSLKDCLALSLSNLTAASGKVFDSDNRHYQLLLPLAHKDIARIAREGVALSNNHMPTLLMSAEGNWLLPDAPDFEAVNWCLKLSDVQSTRLSEALEMATSDARWQYQSEPRLGEFEAGQALRFAKQSDTEFSVKPELSANLGAIHTDGIDTFLTKKAEELAAGKIDFKLDRIAHQVEFEVEIHPPYCPTAATADSIYDAWKSAEEQWHDCLKGLQQQQAEIDKKQQKISERFSNYLAKFFLGQKQEIKALNRELETLKEWAPTYATPGERLEKKQKLESLQEAIRRRSTETENKQQEAEQESRWKEQKRKLEKKLAEQESLLEVKKTDLNNATEAKASKQQAADEAFKLAWQKSVDGLTEKQLEETGLKSDQILKMDVELAEQWKASFKEKVWNKHYSSFAKAMKNLKLALDRIERDIQQAEKSVSTAEKDLESAKKFLEEHGEQFVYRAEKQGQGLEQQLGLNDNKKEQKEISWPKEELPAEDLQLRNHKKQRYLLVCDTDQLDRAREDAERLSAQIVCDKEQINA